VVQLRLPANSRVIHGRTWNEPKDTGRWIELRVYRWIPDEDQLPRLDTYWIDLDRCGPMVSTLSSKSKTKLIRRWPFVAPAAKASAALAP